MVLVEDLAQFLYDLFQILAQRSLLFELDAITGWYLRGVWYGSFYVVLYFEVALIVEVDGGRFHESVGVLFLTFVLNELEGLWQLLVVVSTYALLSARLVFETYTAVLLYLFLRGAWIELVRLRVIDESRQCILIEVMIFRWEVIIVGTTNRSSHFDCLCFLRSLFEIPVDLVGIFDEQ